MYEILFSIIVVIISIRSIIISRYRKKSVEIVFNKSEKWIDFKYKKIKNSEKFDENMFGWTKYWDKRDSYGGYIKMLFDIRKWTFNQFYAGIENYEVEI